MRLKLSCIFLFELINILSTMAIKSCKDCYDDMGRNFYIPHPLLQSHFLLHQCEASPPASTLSSSSGAVCGVTATVLHMDVCVGNNISIQAVQVNRASAGACLLTTGAGMLHSSC